eukprot:scaffold5237_cov116-Isochrysis_galbana.AAC.2
MNTPHAPRTQTLHAGHTSVASAHARQHARCAHGSNTTARALRRHERQAESASATQVGAAVRPRMSARRTSRAVHQATAWAPSSWVAAQTGWRRLPSRWDSACHGAACRAVRACHGARRMGSPAPASSRCSRPT